MILSKVLSRSQEGSQTLEDPRQIYQKKSPLNRGLIAVPVVFLIAGCFFHMSLVQMLVFAFVLGLTVACLVWILKWTKEKIKLRSLLLNVIVHSIILVSAATLCLLCEIVTIDWVGLKRQGGGPGSVAWMIANHTYIMQFWVLILAFSLLVNSARAIRKKLGPGVISAWILGYYHKPRKETRVVMFVDMKDSTSLAEQLGDEKFSALVRDFFATMTRPVEISKGQVSHYIGDEVVLTWAAKEDRILAQSVLFFYLLEEAIKSKSSEFLDKFGHVPGFKAGIHVGPMMVTEVGDIKSEFVLHGDVLNTAARIQGMCSEFNEKLLLSKELACRLRAESWFELKDVGEATLKGKSKPVPLCAASLI